MRWAVVTLDTMVLIAHRLSTVMNADQIIVMNDGQLAEQGTHQELLENDHIYAQLVKIEVGLAWQSPESAWN